jgi:hypothetical protein
MAGGRRVRDLESLESLRSSGPLPADDFRFFVVAEEEIGIGSD